MLIVVIVKYNKEVMSGHNKWSKVKRAKGIKDKVKGNVFSKMSRLITLAVIDGGEITNPENNIKLRMAVDKARVYNMPKENIERAIQKGIGPDKNQLKEEVFEVFGPGGTGFVVLVTTDNPNRTLSEIRNTVESHGAKLGNKGSVQYLFNKCGLVKFNKNDITEEEVFSFADRIGAFDIDQSEESFTVYFPFEKLGKIKEYLGGLKIGVAEVDFKPQTLLTINNENILKKNSELIEALENLEDVHKVFPDFATYA